MHSKHAHMLNAALRRDLVNAAIAKASAEVHGGPRSSGHPAAKP